MQLSSIHNCDDLSCSVLSFNLSRSAVQISLSYKNGYKFTINDRSAFYDWYNAGFESRRLLTTGNADVNVIIPLNRYSFFEELEDEILIPMQLQFNITLQGDDETNCFKKAAAADDGRVVLD